MGRDGELTVIQEKPATNARLTRREMVQRLLAGAGAGAAWPLVAASHPIYEHLANGAIFSEADKLAAAEWMPVFLNAQQDETLAALSESIVPGSTNAQVNRFIDLLLSVDTPEHKQEFVDSLMALETESLKRFGKRFPSLAAGQQDMLLTVVSAKAAEEDSSAGITEKERGTLSGHFENLKGWISGAYYSSEAGMRELGWTGDYVFESFPGCEHPEGHQ